MRLEELLDHWELDSAVDNTELGAESARSAQLHHKYYKFLIGEKIAAKKVEFALKRTRLEVREFLINGATKETQARGWVPLPQGRILVKDADAYVDTWPDVISSAIELALQNEKIALLESIIKVIIWRDRAIGNCIKWATFTAGSN